MKIWVNTALAESINMMQMPETTVHKKYLLYKYALHLLVLLLVSSVSVIRASADNTFVYLLMDEDIPQSASPDGLGNSPSVTAFQCTASGFTRIRKFELSPNDVLQNLIVSPDGRYLFEECQTSSIDPSSQTYYIEYQVLKSGRVRQLRRITKSETGGGVSLSFGSNRTAYMITPYDVKPARISSFRFTLDGRFVFLGNTQQCGETYSSIILPRSGRLAYLPDRQNRLWQYDVEHDGRLKALTPPNLYCGFDPSSIAVLPDGRGIYVTTVGRNAEPGRIYQFGSLGGLLHILKPPYVTFSKEFASLAPSADSRYLYASGRSFTSFSTTASGSLKPTAFRLAGRNLSPITLDLKTGVLYGLDCNQHKLRAFVSGARGELRAIKNMNIPQYGQAIKILVFHQ